MPAIEDARELLQPQDNVAAIVDEEEESYDDMRNQTKPHTDNRVNESVVIDLVDSDSDDGSECNPHISSEVAATRPNSTTGRSRPTRSGASRAAISSRSYHEHEESSDASESEENEWDEGSNSSSDYGFESPESESDDSASGDMSDLIKRTKKINIQEDSDANIENRNPNRGQRKGKMKMIGLTNFTLNPMVINL